MKLKILLVSAILTFTTFFIFAESNQKKADIIFLHDVHSFLKPLAKAKTLIDIQKKNNPDTMILDAGDFSMGTLYQTVFTSHASELRTLGMLGVEATTFGNHEFDYGAEGLESMFTSALKTKEYVPPVVVCNVDWNAENNYTRTVKKSVEEYGLKEYMIFVKDGLKIAVTGVFGKDAAVCAPTCELVFTDPVNAVKKTVEKIKKNESPDLIICISHSGTHEKKKYSEDEILAEKVPELDLIISGHSHTVLPQPIIIGNTVIASCGAYSRYLGNVSLEQNGKGRWKLSSYRLDNLSDDISADEQIENKLSEFDSLIDSEYLSQFNLKTNQILTETDYTLDENTETGFLMAETFYKNLRKNGKLVDITAVPSGVIRGTYKKGNVTVSDVFESFSLGIGNDGITGFPLVDLYFTGKELKELAEVDCSLSGLITYAKLFVHGFSYEYNPERLFLNRVTDIFIVDEDGNRIPVEKNKLYYCVTDLYTARMIAGVMGMSGGIISITPKNSSGQPVTDFSDQILHYDNGKEIKGWKVIADELMSPSMKPIPEYRSYAEKTAVRCPSFNPVKLFSNPSRFAIIVRLILLCFVSVSLIIILIVKKTKKMSKN